MPDLEKAKIEPVRADRNNSSAGTEFEVQFNPTSLKLKLVNQNEGGDSRARQRRQHTASGSTTLSMDLVFDSADETSGEGASPQPVSVRRKTGQLEQFLVPGREGGETPPRMKFSWNDLVFVGIVDDLSIDFDLFAPSGEPLRAKVSLTIKEQEPKYQFLEAGAGARDNGNAQAAGNNPGTQPGAGTNDPGGEQPGNSERSAPALEGETAPEFTARQGLNPAAWRGLDVDLSAGLTLEAGVQVGFSAGLNVNAGIGLSVGVQAGADLSLKAAVGLEAGAGVNTGASGSRNANTTAGHALSAAGGVAAAIEVTNTVESQNAAQAAVEAFETPRTTAATGSASAAAGSTVIRSAVDPTGMNAASLRAAVQPPPARTPLTQSGPRSYSDQQNAPAAASAPKADPRAITYGFGVPLRPTMGEQLVQSQPRVCGHGGSQVRRAEGTPGFRKTPTQAPWVQLPARSPARAAADQVQKEGGENPCGILYRRKP